MAANGRILDPSGRVLKDYSSGGLPAFLEFEIPAGAEYFTLEVNGTRVNQALSDRAHAPVAERPPVVSAAPPSAPPVPPPAAPPAPPAKAAPPAAKETPAEEDENSAEWRDLPLEFGKPEEGHQEDVHLEEQEDE